MDGVFALFGDFKDPRIGGADSFTDRLSSRVTFILCVTFSLFVATTHFMGNPVSCWCPSFFTESHTNYTNKVCWTSNTYYLPFSKDRVPKEREERQMITYYQWVSLILAFQAVLFYLPRPLWRLFNKKSGMAVSTITDAAIECQRKTESEGADKTMRYMVKHMGRFLLELSRNHLMANKFKSFWWALYGNYLVILYMIIKLLYITNVIGQLFLLNAFLGTDYHLYGIDVLRRIARNENWTTSDRFPRVAMCDFKIRVLGNIHRFTVQCSLPMNLFNEIIFIFLWFWFVFVAAATVGSLLMWLASSLYFPYQMKWVKSRLIAMEKIKHETKKERITKFVCLFLRRDGIFILRMVAKNSSDVIAAELLGGLWEHYKDNEKSVERLSKKDEAVLSDLNI
ncbi:hypothetical protein CAPTEDRAFT_114804 [Capitella teleta]|uniref:Innexin n=1 Tax=Capitella teleta TaxID=283909 RepID=R7VJN8_CAPTE|nr:hypothetical protein CAPTEDRAFT_114804 [Capitella teleta]|eukprot:ELU16070.1 hypothetical protein CAPTEDRAFT_114804 [Capitella teleta]